MLAMLNSTVDGSRQLYSTVVHACINNNNDCLCCIHVRSMLVVSAVLHVYTLIDFVLVTC